MIYKKTKNLRAVQLLLGHSKLKTLFDIWGLKLTMHWKFQNKLKFDARRGTVNFLRADFSQHFWMSNRNFEQGFCRAGWASAALFPVLQSAS